MGLGAYPTITLANAREKAASAGYCGKRTRTRSKFEKLTNVQRRKKPRDG